MPIAEKTTLLGLSRVIPQEAPLIACRCLDVGMPPFAHRAAAQVVGEIVGGDGAGGLERVVACRRSARLVETYERVSLPCGPPTFRNGGVYVITGGLGGIGLALASHLALLVRARIALIGRVDRSKTDADIAARIDAMRVVQVEVLVEAADVADAIAVEQSFRRIESALGPVEGVFHAAGERTAIGQTFNTLRRKDVALQFRAKVLGLYALQRDRPATGPILPGVFLDGRGTRRPRLRRLCRREHLHGQLRPSAPPDRRGGSR